MDATHNSVKVGPKSHKIAIGLSILASEDVNTYLKRLPLDPWGSPYQFSNPGKNSNIDIYSLGADQQIGGDGMNKDIGNWNLNE